MSYIGKDVAPQPQGTYSQSEIDTQMLTKVPKVTSTDNAVVRFDGTSGQVQNSSVVIDDSGSVGIGTSSPSAKLHTTIGAGAINGAKLLNANGSGLQIYTDTTASNADVFIESPTSSAVSMIFKNNGSERMRIDSAGNIGIGVTPSWWQNIYKALEAYSGSLSFRTDIPSFLQLNSNAYSTTTSYIYKNNGMSASYQHYNGAHYWFTAPSGTAGNAITWTTAMNLGANGNLLVGTATDNGVDKLQVNGTISSGEIPPTYADLNSLTTVTRNYVVPSGQPNMPINDYCYVEVIVHNSAWVLQRATVFGASNIVNAGRTFVRTLSAGVWTTWVEK